MSLLQNILNNYFFQFNTWGNVDNTWTYGGSEDDGVRTRLDYVFYKLRAGGLLKNVQVESYNNVEEKISSGGNMISLSDHSFVETTLRLGLK